MKSRTGKRSVHKAGAEASLSGVGERIRELRRQRGLTQAQLAAEVGIRSGPMNYLEMGHHLPSLPVLYRLSRVFDVSVDTMLAQAASSGAVREDSAHYYVKTESPPVMGYDADFAHRALVLQDGRAKPLGTEVLAILNRLVQAFFALEDLCGAQKRANIPLTLAMPKAEIGLEPLVARVRMLLGVGDAVIFDYLELMENAGLRILFIPLGAETMSLSCYDATSQNAFIFVDKDMNVERQLFRLAYELARIYCHTGGVRELRKIGGGKLDLHHTCSKFAALFLMPEEAVHASVRQVGVKPDAWCYELLLRLKHRFGVSAESFLYRLDELGLIAPECVKELKARIHAHYEKTAFAEPDSSRRTLTPNGRLGDLLLGAAHRYAGTTEVEEIRAELAKYRVKMPWTTLR